MWAVLFSLDGIKCLKTNENIDVEGPSDLNPVILGVWRRLPWPCHSREGLSETSTNKERELLHWLEMFWFSERSIKGNSQSFVIC